MFHSQFVKLCSCKRLNSTIWNIPTYTQTHYCHGINLMKAFNQQINVKVQSWNQCNFWLYRLEICIYTYNIIAVYPLEFHLYLGLLLYTLKKKKKLHSWLKRLLFHKIWPIFKSNPYMNRILYPICGFVLLLCRL